MSVRGRDFWGPPTWASGHIFASGFRDTDEWRNAFIDCVHSWIWLLPCDSCKVHLDGNLETLPPHKHLQSKEDVFRWFYDVHDTVNGQVGKSSPSYTKVKKEYSKGMKNDTFWGPPIWAVIHSFTTAYEPSHNTSIAFVNFIHSLTELLPTEDSRRNWSTLLENMPMEPYLVSRDSLFLWGFLVHDSLNRMIGRVENIEFDDAKRFYYEALVGECSSCTL